MAVSALVKYNVWQNGNALNGGGYRTVGGSTDYSGQTTAQLTVTDLVSNGTTTLTSVTGGFTAAMIGNVLQVSGGTVPAGFYEIITNADPNTITVDRTVAAGTGSTAKVGGALATIAQAIAAITSGSGGLEIHVKYSATPYSLSNATMTPGAAVNPNAMVISGYNTTFGDLDSVTNFANFPTIQKTAGTEAIFTITAANNRIRNLILDGNSLATHGITNSSGSMQADNIKAINCTTFGFLSGAGQLSRCVATACAAGFTVSTAGGSAFACVAHANTGIGFTTGASVTIDSCLSYANTGASSHGFHSSGSTGGGTIRACVAYGNGGDGVRLSTAGGSISTRVQSCILVNNAGYGLMYSSTGTPTSTMSNRNAYYNNTNGPLFNMPAGPNDVPLSGDPFTNAAAGDFSLDATTGEGVACRAAGSPATFPLGLTVSYRDIGAAQHADPAAEIFTLTDRANIVAIKAKTDLLTYHDGNVYADVREVLDVDVPAVPDPQIVSVGGYEAGQDPQTLLDGSLDSIQAASDAAAASFTTTLTEAYRTVGATGTAAQLLYEIRALLANHKIVGTEKIIRNLAGTDMLTYPLDSATTATDISEETP